jgi:hypothetical protein
VRCHRADRPDHRTRHDTRTGHQLPEITVAEIDRYRTFKVREGALSSESINKTITRLGQVLAVAAERDLVTRNPVRVNTRNRKLKTRRRRPVYLDSVEQIAALLEAAADLDRRPTASAGTPMAHGPGQAEFTSAD